MGQGQENEDPHAVLGRSARGWVGEFLAAGWNWLEWLASHPFKAMGLLSIHLFCFGVFGEFLDRVHEVGWSNWVVALHAVNSGAAHFTVSAEGFSGIYLLALLTAVCFIGGVAGVFYVLSLIKLSIGRGSD